MSRRGRIAAALVLFIIVSVSWHTFAIWLPPGPGDPYNSSYSAAPYGFRALHGVLDRIDVRVLRNTYPPPLLFKGERRIVLLEPDLFALEKEKGALTRMADWVREGGQLVVVSASLGFEGPPWTRYQQSTYTGRKNTKDGEDDTAASGGGSGESGTPDDGEENNEDGQDSGTRKKERALVKETKPETSGEVREPAEILGQNDWLRNFGIVDLAIEGVVYDAQTEDSVYSPFEGNMITMTELNRPSRVCAVTEGTGAFAAVVDGVDVIDIPEDDTAFFVGNAVDGASGVWKVRFNDKDDSEAIGLHYAIGNGDLIIVCQPALFTNVALGNSNNAVAATRIVAGDGSREVVLDEYYKGNSIAGQPLALFGVFPYGLVLGSALAACLLATWSFMVRLGPPLPDAPPPRRSLVEYVGAMAMLFRRGGHTRFVLDACRKGILQDLRRSLHLPHDAPLAAILHRLHRVAPGNATLLENTLRAVDGALNGDGVVTPGQVLTLMEKLEACRLTPPQKPAPTGSPSSISAR